MKCGFKNEFYGKEELEIDEPPGPSWVVTGWSVKLCGKRHSSLLGAELLTTPHVSLGIAADLH